MADKLIRMANQIADFFRSQPGIAPEQAVAAHINDFWPYAMRADLLELIHDRAKDSGADPVVQAALPLIRQAET